MRKPTIPDLMTFNGGYVDAAGFIALHGLFTAHVTGNFVTIGASLVHGASGIIGKLAVLPVFCLAALLARVAWQRLASRQADVVRVMTAAMVLLLGMAAALAVGLGPFPADSPGEIATGMFLVMAMAIQNVMHRVHFPKSPPTNLMTGSTTQVMIDLADLWRSELQGEERAASRARCITLARAVVIFAAGCAIAALIYLAFGLKVFMVPPLVAALAFLPVFRPARADKTSNQS